MPSSSVYLRVMSKLSLGIRLPRRTVLHLSCILPRATLHHSSRDHVHEASLQERDPQAKLEAGLRHKPDRFGHVVSQANGNHHRVAAKEASKVERGRPATSVHGFVRPIELPRRTTGPVLMESSEVTKFACSAPELGTLCHPNWGQLEVEMSHPVLLDDKVKDKDLALAVRQLSPGLGTKPKTKHMFSNNQKTLGNDLRSMTSEEKP